MEKNYSISFIRLIAMLMIVSCHILQGLNNRWAFWVNVGVQMFFIISGYLYGTKKINTQNFYKTRIKKILLPCSILTALIFFIEMVFLKKQYRKLKIIACVLGFGGFYGNTPILSHTWFVSYILICYLMLPLLQKIFNNTNYKQNLKRFLLLVVLLQALELFRVVNINACWINNFIFGYFYSKCCTNSKDKKNIKILTIIVFFVIIPFAIILQEKINIPLPNIIQEYSVYIMNYGHVFLGTVLVILLYKIFNKINIKHSILLELSDKYSYYIFLVHQIFILNSFSLLFITKNLIINILAILIASIISAVFLKFLSDSFLKLKDINFKEKMLICKYKEKNRE